MWANYRCSFWDTLSISDDIFRMWACLYDQIVLREVLEIRSIEALLSYKFFHGRKSEFLCRFLTSKNKLNIFQMVDHERSRKKPYQKCSSMEIVLPQSHPTQYSSQHTINTTCIQICVQSSDKLCKSFEIKGADILCSIPAIWQDCQYQFLLSDNNKLKCSWDINHDT